MSAIHTQCPPDSVLNDFGLGKLDAAEADTIARHIGTCTDCERRVASLSGDTFVGRLRQADAGGKSAPRRERTYVPGESLVNAANSTDGSLNDGLSRPSRPSPAQTSNDALVSPSSVSAPSELVNHPDYELVKELGQGGMGTVYLAKNRMMDRLEVLKVISKELLARPGALERFQQEIRSAAKLAHPNIVAAYSVLRPDDLLVFAMEYVKGQDLSQVVKQRSPLPVANAAFYIHQVAHGLQHAFEKGMVHRDIKPNNLMLAIEGKKHTVKILDFGLAKATSEKGAETGLTKSGQMLGTPDYVAPEQTLNAQQADIRADIYSLGCTLYFLLSGGPPFQEASLYEILEAHHKREPNPLNLVRHDVPVELAAVVGKMMAKDPAKRYQTPGEVAKALVPFFKPGQSAATSPPTGATQSSSTGDTAHGLGAATPISPPTPSPIVVAQPMMTAIQPASKATIVAHKPSKSPQWPTHSWIAIAAGAAFIALLLGVIGIIRNHNGKEVARVEVRQGESVEVNPTETNSPGPPDSPKNDSPFRQSGPALEKPATETAVGGSAPSGASAKAERAAAGGSSTGNAPPPVVEEPTADYPSEAAAPDDGMPLESVPTEKMPETTEPEDEAADEIHGDGSADVSGPAGTVESPATLPSADGAAANKPPGAGRIARNNRPPSGTAFKANTKWANPTWTMTVNWRSGAKFKATYRFRGNVLAVAGTINGNQISWRGKDVRILKGRVGNDDTDGTLVATNEGYKIHFSSRNGRGQVTNWIVDRK
jgi:serine/threonine protein kinase